MDTFVKTVFGLLFGWVQTLASMLWNDFYIPDGESAIRWIGEHWILLAALLCVAGTVADIMLRKRRRKKKKPEAGTEEIQEEPIRNSGGTPERQGAYFAVNDHVYDERNLSADRNFSVPAEDDLSRWRESAPEPEEEIPEPDTTVTEAGYVVPADSPYRRPAGFQRQILNEEYDLQRSPERIAPRRRRRRIVSGLLGDDEEKRYDTPLPMIDQREAYNDPVYPRKWKDNGGQTS